MSKEVGGIIECSSIQQHKFSTQQNRGHQLLAHIMLLSMLFDLMHAAFFLLLVDSG